MVGIMTPSVPKVGQNITNYTVSFFASEVQQFAFRWACKCLKYGEQVGVVLCMYRAEYAAMLIAIFQHNKDIRIITDLWQN